MVLADVGNVAGAMVEIERRMERPIRILRLIARLNIGGPAIQAINLSCALSKDGYETLLAAGHITPGEGDMGYLADGRDFEPLFVDTLGREISLRNDIKSFFALRRIIKWYRPHILHTHTAKAGFIGRMAALSSNLFRLPGSRIRMVHTFHGHTFHSYFGRFKSAVFIFIEKLLAVFTDRIVVVSERQKADINRKYRIAGEGKTIIIPLGFDLAPFGSDEKRRHRMRRCFVSESQRDAAPLAYCVGIIGRLTKVKNHQMLLLALKRLQELERLDNFRLVIIGDGELRRDLETEIDRLGIGDAIIFAGWQREMAAVYDGLDAVVITSDNEGTPVALIEAMAAGKPVAATDVGGVPDLLGEIRHRIQGAGYMAERGILVEKNSPDGMAQALLYLRNHPGEIKGMVSTAKQHVSQTYSFERLTTDIKTLYNSLV